jgi:hypothetical protein
MFFDEATSNVLAHHMDKYGYLLAIYNIFFFLLLIITVIYIMMETLNATVNLNN